MVAFDIESTGVDPETARIVTADVARIEPSGKVVEPRSYLADPGVEIPAEATEVHGITTEHARKHGMDPADLVLLLVDDLESPWREGIPVVAFNAVYDLTVVDRELRRHHGRPLAITGGVLDPFVIDKAVDRYRKGSRKLGDVCKHYGLTLDNAHNSAADAEATGLVMLKMAEWYPGLREKSLRDLWIHNSGRHTGSRRRASRRTCGARSVPTASPKSRPPPWSSSGTGRCAPTSSRR
jgi:DNA polymerase-3 subunit epsilon